MEDPEQMSKTKAGVALIFVGFRTKDWILASEKIKRQLLNQHYEVKLVDISKLIWPRHISVREKSAEANSVTKTGSTFLQQENDSLLSAIRSFRRDSSKELSKLERLLFRRSARRLNSFLRELKSCTSPNLVVIPNGRLPHEIQIESFFGDTRLAFYELPYWGKDAFFADFSPQELSKLHLSVSRRAELDRGTLLKLYSESMDMRTSANYSLNPFVVNDENRHLPVESDVVFFTSSNDEYWQLGRKSKTDSPSEWESQISAFDYAISSLRRAGYEKITVRVHPNLANKAIKEYKRETQAIRKLSNKYGAALSVIWPEEKFSSYALAENASLIVVWWSAAGLESSARGKPVIALHDGRYVFETAMHVARTKSELKCVIDESLKSLDANRKKSDQAKLIIGALAELESLDSLNNDSTAPVALNKLTAAYISGGPARVFMSIKFRLLRLGRIFRYSMKNHILKRYLLLHRPRRDN